MPLFNILIYNHLKAVKLSFTDAGLSFTDKIVIYLGFCLFQVVSVRIFNFHIFKLENPISIL